MYFRGSRHHQTQYLRFDPHHLKVPSQNNMPPQEKKNIEHTSKFTQVLQTFSFSSSGKFFVFWSTMPFFVVTVPRRQVGTPVLKIDYSIAYVILSVIYVPPLLAHSVRQQSLLSGLKDESQPRNFAGYGTISKKKLKIQIQL